MTEDFSISGGRTEGRDGERMLVVSELRHMEILMIFRSELLTLSLLEIILKAPVGQI